MQKLSSSLFLVFVSCLVASLSASLTAAENQNDNGLYGTDAGPQETQTVATYDLKDKKRDKTLPLRLTFPKAAGKYPLIVFSHGAMGSKDAYAPLIEHWVSHGYVCIQPTHEDSLQLLLRSGDRFRLQNVWSKWNTRPPDVQLILDSLDELEDNVAGLKGKIDRERIGVGGHSFGAHTSQLIGGVKLQNPITKRFESFADERPDAVLLISPQGSGDSLVPESWSGLTRPAMVITGSNDKSPRNGKDHLWRKEVYDHSPDGDRYLLMIDGAYHGFGGITGARRFPGSGPANADHVSYVKGASLAFWDLFLKENAEAGPWLRTDQFTKATGGAAELSTKFEEQ